jgi:SAM-dependent methyltransferase
MGDSSRDGLPTVWLDSPEPGELVHDSIYVKGWAVPDGLRFSAEAWLGDRRLGFLDLVPRPDVAQIAGFPGATLVGFESTFAVDIREGGTRQLLVKVTAADGAEYRVERPVQLDRAPGQPRSGPARGYRLLRDAPAADGEAWPWFREHHDQAAAEIIEFLEGSRLSLEGLTVADVGCGDGIIDLGLMSHARPRELVGFDLEAVSRSDLLEEARANGHELAALPDGLEFRVCSPTMLPADDDSFDAVISWSSFEHVRHTVRLMREIRRVLRPRAFVFLQIWPLWWSQHGSHLWPWYPQGFAPLLHSDDELLAAIASDPHGSPEELGFIAHEYRQLNRITVDELQRSLLAAGLAVTKFELITSRVHIPVELSRFPLSDLGIEGIKLTAIPV